MSERKNRLIGFKVTTSKLEEFEEFLEEHNLNKGDTLRTCLDLYMDNCERVETPREAFERSTSEILGVSQEVIRQKAERARLIREKHPKEEVKVNLRKLLHTIKVKGKEYQEKVKRERGEDDTQECVDNETQLRLKHGMS